MCKIPYPPHSQKLNRKRAENHPKAIFVPENSHFKCPKYYPRCFMWGVRTFQRCHSRGSVTSHPLCALARVTRACTAGWSAAMDTLRLGATQSQSLPEKNGWPVGTQSVFFCCIPALCLTTLP